MLDECYKDQLRNSGVTFLARYIGYVRILESISDMKVEKRQKLVTECILHISGLTGTTPEHDIEESIKSCTGAIKLENCPVEINISSKIIRIIRDNRIIQRLPLDLFSFGSKAQNVNPLLESMFGFIAKNKKQTERSCFIVESKEISKFIGILTSAIEVAQLDSESQSSSHSNGFAVPQNIPPKMRSREVNDDPIAADVSMKPWYHSVLSREDAQSLIHNPGDFLVRQSPHSPGQYILSGLTKDGEYKHLILLDDQMKIRTEEITFGSISELIDYHMDGTKPVVSKNETSICLINPIRKRN